MLFTTGASGGTPTIKSFLKHLWRVDGSVQGTLYLGPLYEMKAHVIIEYTMILVILLAVCYCHVPLFGLAGCHS